MQFPPMRRGSENHFVVLGDKGVMGLNVVAPGTSGIPPAPGAPSPHFADQVGLLLNYEYKPMRFYPPDVRSFAESEERLSYPPAAPLGGAPFRPEEQRHEVGQVPAPYGPHVHAFRLHGHVAHARLLQRARRIRGCASPRVVVLLPGPDPQQAGPLVERGGGGALGRDPAAGASPARR